MNILYIFISTNKYVIVDWKSAKERYRMVLEQMCMWCGEGSPDEVTFKLRIWR